MLKTSTLTPLFETPYPRNGSWLPEDLPDLKPARNESGPAEIGLGLAAILNHSPCVTWILNVKTQHFDFISANTAAYFGYEQRLYTGSGHRFHESTKQPDDAANVRTLRAHISNALTQTARENWPGYKFSYDYRIIRPNGGMVRILEQNTILDQDAQGEIAYLLCSCIDISDWKKSDLQVATLISQDDDRYFLFTAEKTAPRLQTSLSKRELEILKLISEGRSSKYIAEKLFISFHTVNTHRQKMIEKTNSKNTGGLVQFAAANGLI